MLSPSRFVEKQMAKRRENRVFQVLVSRAPNGLRLPHLKRLIPDLTEEAILQALAGLMKKGQVVPLESKNAFIPGRVISVYALSKPTQFPMKDTITIGGVEFPRSFHGDVVGAEDLNALIEAIAEYDATIETRITDLAAALTRRYWVNIATIFALFVAVFALILRTAEPLPVLPETTPLALLFMKAAELIPLAVVLFGFVVVLWLVLRMI